MSMNLVHKFQELVYECYSKSLFYLNCKILNSPKNLLPYLNYNRWKNTNEVHIREKDNCKFIHLDIKEFYLSIYEETLNKAIDFTENCTSISQENIRIKKHCRKCLLVYGNEPWKKNSTTAPLMLQWAAMMEQSFVTWLVYTFSFYWKTTWNKIKGFIPRW